ncbi:MAG: aldo/keto reductase [Caulobacteraceae bacterium]
MRYNQLGRTGLFVSELCLGAMTFAGDTNEGAGIWAAIGSLGQKEVDELVKLALDAGINFIDTANVYSQGHSEMAVGQALKNLGIKRTDVVVATKVFGTMGPGPNDNGASRGHIMDQVDESLRRLQTDHIDLYQIHATDPVTPIDETLRALDEAHRQGAGDLRAQGLRPVRDAAGVLHHRRPRPGARHRPAADRGGRWA